jgi:Flp pilus assembly protein TadG
MKHGFRTYAQRLRLAVELKRDSEGSALVEMAILLPVMMLIMTGIFSFSLLLFQQIQLTENVCNAGRYLAVARQAPDPCATVYSAINNAPGLGASPTITITQNGTAIPTTCPYNSTTNTSYLTQGATVKVSVIANSSLAVYGFRPTTFHLGSQIAEIVQ